MISLNPCLLPLCNTQMLIDDYSNAIYWRIAAIFSTIASLFSAAVVLWYLIFRDNPNLPDETDSKERLRFRNDIDKKKYNLFSEIVANFTNIPSMNASNIRKPNPKSQTFTERLAYFLFGTNSDDDENTLDLENDADNCEICEISNKNLNNSNKTKYQILNENLKTLPANRENKTKPSKLDKRDSFNTTDSKSDFKNYKRYVNTKKSLNISNNNANSSRTTNDEFQIAENNKNTNNNNSYIINPHHRSFSETNLKPSSTGFAKSPIRNEASIPLLCNLDLFSDVGLKLETSERFLNELSRNFQNLMSKLYADANLTNISYLAHTSCILVMFDSLVNISSSELSEVNLIIDVYYKEKFKKRLFSQLDSIDKLDANEQKLFKQTFLVKLSPNMSPTNIELNVFIIGKVVGLNESESQADLSSLLLASKSACLQDRKILGGAHVILKNFI